MGAIIQDRIARTLEKFEREAETLDEIVQRMGGALTDSDGVPMYQGLPAICKDWDVPYGKVLAWLMADEKRYAVYQRCLEVQAHLLVAETVELADGAEVRVATDAAGQVIEDKQGNPVLIEPDVARDKLRVDTRFRVAKYHAGKLYGDKQEGGAGGVTVVINRGVGSIPGAETITISANQDSVL